MRTDADAEEDRTLEIAPPINPRADWRVADVQALPGYRLRVRFNDATEGEVDMSQLIEGSHAGVFAALRDDAYDKLFELRLIADYMVTGIDADQATRSLSQAEAIVAEMRRLLAGEGKRPGRSNPEDLMWRIHLDCFVGECPPRNDEPVIATASDRHAGSNPPSHTQTSRSP